jgi:hypothetical protein
LNEEGRHEYVGQGLTTKIRKTLDSDEDRRNIFWNKKRTYDVYRKFYGREVVKISGERDRAKFHQFVSSHDRFFVKPTCDRRGNGAYIADKTMDMEKLFQNACQLDGGVVLEELIEQSAELAKFHPASVNTVRFVTFYYKNKLHKIMATMRMGRSGNVVDNGGSEGIFATIDMATGIIDAPASSFKGGRYLVHPDTGVQIIGVQIPRWDELNKTVEEAVRVLPEQHFIGWDFALTDKGWIMVEANDGPGMQILSNTHGLRNEMRCMFDAYAEKQARHRKK